MVRQMWLYVGDACTQLRLIIYGASSSCSEKFALVCKRVHEVA
jgi:hypothetical protein